MKKTDLLLSREEQIHLMITSKDRLADLTEQMMKDPELREILLRPHDKLKK